MVLIYTAIILYVILFGVFPLRQGIKFISNKDTEKDDLLLFGFTIHSNTYANGIILLLLGIVVIIILSFPILSITFLIFEYLVNG